MKKIKIGVIGAGTVGFSFIKLLRACRSQIKRDYGLDLELAVVCERSSEIRKRLSEIKVQSTDDADSVLGNADIDLIVELIGGLKPAKDFVVKALTTGKDVVTANKALLALHGQELFALAAQNNCVLKFEAAVAGAIPIIKPLTENLTLGGVQEIYGILNGTTNYVLYNMTKHGLDYSSVLADAQAKGYAEADPTTDVKGYDAMHKICLLSYMAFGSLPDVSKVFCQGIDTVTSEDIAFGLENNMVIKLLAVARKTKASGLEVRVNPCFVPADHPLAKIDAAINAVFVNTAKCGPFLFSGFGAGGDPTAMSVLSDVLDIARGAVPFNVITKKSDEKFIDVGNTTSLYYLRFSIVDKPGVLARIASILASYGISIDTVQQKGTQIDKTKHVPLVILTHKAVDQEVRNAVKEIDKLSMTRRPAQVIKIEEL